MDVQLLEVLSIQLNVGDILEIAFTGEEFASEQMIEIPIACKLVKKDTLLLYFHPHELDLDLNTLDIHSKKDQRYLTVHSLEIVDAEKGYLATYEEEEFVRYQVMWKKIANISD
ncbi:hypothetical protein [Acaryochloris marina]|uniref:Uncharacterized protein n=1 Tax=Acaryochloris marina (strain MBIC 11017) TaxID=329726 RepID=A8ZMA6_ACAM1|nr:hypothetical protein [Acaryochloris marina]ABW32317.1 hypothetical protein AM1_C0007 [Acaryochloris marina MBIC11017]